MDFSNFTGDQFSQKIIQLIEDAPNELMANTSFYASGCFEPISEAKYREVQEKNVGTIFYQPETVYSNSTFIPDFMQFEGVADEKATKTMDLATNTVYIGEIKTVDRLKVFNIESGMYFDRYQFIYNLRNRQAGNFYNDVLRIEKSYTSKKFFTSSHYILGRILGAFKVPYVVGSTATDTIGDNMGDVWALERIIQTRHLRMIGLNQSDQAITYLPDRVYNNLQQFNKTAFLIDYNQEAFPRFVDSNIFLTPGKSAIKLTQGDPTNCSEYLRTNCGIPNVKADGTRLSGIQAPKLIDVNLTTDSGGYKISVKVQATGGTDGVTYLVPGITNFDLIDDVNNAPASLLSHMAYQETAGLQGGGRENLQFVADFPNGRLSLIDGTVSFSPILQQNGSFIFSITAPIITKSYYKDKDGNILLANTSIRANWVFTSRNVADKDANNQPLDGILYNSKKEADEPWFSSTKITALKKALFGAALDKPWTLRQLGFLEGNLDFMITSNPKERYEYPKVVGINEYQATQTSSPMPDINTRMPADILGAGAFHRSAQRWLFQEQGDLIMRMSHTSHINKFKCNTGCTAICLGTPTTSVLRQDPIFFSNQQASDIEQNQVNENSKMDKRSKGVM